MAKGEEMKQNMDTNPKAIPGPGDLPPYAPEDEYGPRPSVNARARLDRYLDYRIKEVKSLPVSEQFQAYTSLSYEVLAVRCWIAGQGFDDCHNYSDYQWCDLTMERIDHMADDALQRWRDSIDERVAGDRLAAQQS